ncbi:MAG: rod shape-determining protein MreC [Paracoccaceae bacterium]|nr:rod shape-determining protein MreC [Paracoccaceae bacterium]MDE2917419.1 rod shape-determining protein MreC [Paracoccaceae bacterium]MYE37854.1 rod shape-determining protein MreC [Paracoccaceae bacterium]
MLQPENNQQSTEFYKGSIKRLLLLITLIILFCIFLLWRLEGTRVESARASIVNLFVPVIELGLRPFEYAENTADVLVNAVQNQVSLDDLVQMRNELNQWKNYAYSLEEENAKLKKLVNFSETSDFQTISAAMLADTSSPFRHSYLINVGSERGVKNGYPASDGLGLIGRITNTSRKSARLILLTDTSSRVPVRILPSGKKGLVVGNNTANPDIELLDNLNGINPGDRVLTTGEGGIFPPDLLVGTVSEGPDGTVEITLATEYNNLKMISIIKYEPESLEETDVDLLSSPPTGPVEDI